jgi:hypothetical protein
MMRTPDELGDVNQLRLFHAQDMSPHHGTGLSAILAHTLSPESS